MCWRSESHLHRDHHAVAGSRDCVNAVLTSSSRSASHDDPAGRLSHADGLDGGPDAERSAAPMDPLELSGAESVGRGHSAGEVMVKARIELGGSPVLDGPEGGYDARDASGKECVSEAEAAFHSRVERSCGVARGEDDGAGAQET